MQYWGMQVEGLDTAVVDYINEIKTNYENQILNLKNTVIEYQNKYLVTKECLDLLLYKKFCRSAEQLQADTIQQSLFHEEPEQSEATETESNNEELQTIKSYQRKKAGRKPLNPNLERIPRIIDIPESEKTCACGAQLTRIGEEISEKLNIIPQRIFVEKIIRPKYACRCCEGTANETFEDEGKPTVRIASVEPSIIPKSIASPSLLSTIFTYKFERHLPYYRQEKMYEQIGADISRQDMSNWQQHVYQKLEPLFELLKKNVKSGPVIQMDETTVQVVHEPERKPEQKSYMWLSVGGLPDKTVVWYEYHQTRSARHARDFLHGYSGYLQTDGYEGYDSAVKGMPDIVHAGCFAHARRKFFEASSVNKESKSAHEGIKYIRKLYAIEDTLRDRWKKDHDTEKFLKARKEEADPALKKFKAWLEKRKDEVPPSTLLGKAIHYTLAQWDKLIAYLESPYLTPDNNACENAIRPFVLGRKNWLFSQSPSGAKSSCGIYTLIETAKQNGLVPYDYLKTLFEMAPLADTPEKWKKLLPWNIFTA